MLASPRNISQHSLSAYIVCSSDALLLGPSSHVILNALNLKAFICNRIITAGTVIRFAVSPKRIYSSRTGNVGAESRVHPGSRDFRSSSCSTQERRSASKLSILIANKRRSRDAPRYVAAIMVTTGRSLCRIRFLSSAISSSSLPHTRLFTATPWFSFQSKSHTINHMDYKALTAGDCSLFWVLGDENFVSRGRVV